VQADRLLSAMKSNELRIPGAILLIVAVVFLISGPVVRWVGTTAGIDRLPNRETAAFVNPTAASAGFSGGSQVRIAITSSRQGVIRWSEAVNGTFVSRGTVTIRPGAPSDIQVLLPKVNKASWATISIDRLATPLRVEVRPE